MRETENVVDEKQHVLVVLVTEVLGHGQCRECHAETGTGRLVHLTVTEGHLGALFGEDGVALVVELGVAVLVLFAGDNAGLDHFPVEVVALTGALTHTGEHGETTVGFGDVVDELHDHHGLAHTRTTEHATLAALEQRADEINHLDAGRQHLGGSGLLGE